MDSQKISVVLENQDSKCLKVPLAANMEKANENYTQRDPNVYFIPSSNHADVKKKYRVLKKEIGRGGYGTVRICEERKSGKRFAIKTMHKSRIDAPELLTAEIQNQQSLSHPNIARLRDVFEDSKYIHLIMPLYTGGDLFHRVSGKKLQETTYSEQEAADLARQMLDAVAYCHSTGIVHRDLKPENFVFESKESDSTLKLIDFGLSANIHTDDEKAVMTSFVGTLAYSAPEVLDCRYTNKCDIWSVGVIIYILLSGYPPFYGHDDVEISGSIKSGKLHFPNPGWDSVSPEAKHLLQLLLNKNPYRRPTAKQALEHSWFRKNTPFMKPKAKFIQQKLLCTKLKCLQKLTLDITRFLTGNVLRCSNEHE